MAHYDLFVIGGGSGGVACARRSAAYGASVGLAEGSRMGGTCVIRGCVPKKLMHYAGLFGDFVQTARSFGWKAGHPEHDFQALLRARNEEIARLNGIYVGMLEKAGVAIHAGRATLGPHRDGAFTIEVTTAGGPEHHSADRVVVAVGARPVMPDIEGIEHAVTSDFMLEEIYPLPRRFTVVGAGYIGLEIAGIMNGLGADTTLLLRGEEPLRGFDDDLRREITAGLERHGLTIRPKTVVRRIAKNADGAIVLDTDRGPVEADLLLYATGRKPIPQTENIGLEALGVEKTADGSICVDAAYRTNVEGLYAVGDGSDHAGFGLDAGQHDLTPVAIAEGRVIAETLYNDNPHGVRYDTIPTAVFATPQAGSVGLSEAYARALDYDIAVYTTSFRPMLHSLEKGDQRTMMKLIVDKATDRVIGCHMVGDDASEIIQGLAVAMTAGATKAQFDATVGVHPSTAEEFVTMYQPVQR